MIPGSSSSPIAPSRDTKWKQIRRFGDEGDGEGQLRRADGIAVCSTGDVAITDTTVGRADDNRVFVFSSEGEYKHTVKSHPTNPAGKLLYPARVAVTSDNHVVITDQSADIKIFHVNGSFVKSFSTLAPGENPVPKVKAFAVGIAVSNQNEIIVGDRNRQCITIHTHSSVFIKKLLTPIIPIYLATNSHLIIISDWMARKVIGMTRDGRVVFTLDRFVVNGEGGRPSGITCASNDDVYIAVKQVDESTGNAIYNTGHIHQYDSNGVFSRCIIRDLYSPRGLAMSNGKLFIANDTSILVYSQE